MADDTYSKTIPYYGSVDDFPDTVIVLSDPIEAESHADDPEIVPETLSRGKTDFVPIFSTKETALEFIRSQGYQLEAVEKSREEIRMWGILLSSVSQRKIVYVLDLHNIEQLKHLPAG